MALEQTKVIQKRTTSKSIHKNDLAKELNVPIATINEYILGDIEPPTNLRIVPKTNGIVSVEYTTEIEVPKHEGVFFNRLKNGDRTFYIVYKDIRTNKKVDLKVGRESDGITEKFCENKRKDILDEIRLGEKQTKIKNRRIFKEITTFDMVAEQYHLDRELHMTKENLRDAKATYRNHIQPYIGDTPIDEITDDDIKKIQIDKKDLLAPRTINIIVEKISTIFNFAIKKKLYTKSNPIVHIEKLVEDNKRTRFLSKDEMKSLFNEVQYNNTLYLFTFIALSTGARLRIICNIKMKDIDLVHNFINLYDTKNKSYYKAFIKEDPRFISILSSMKESHNPNDFVLGRKTMIANKRYIERELPKIFNKLFNQNIIITEDMTAEQKAEVRREKVVIHTLRHTFASQLVINGTPLFTVSSLINHKDTKSTQRYAKLAPDSGREDINAIF